MSRTLKELLAQGAESATAVSAPGRPALSHGGLRRLIEATLARLNSLGLGRNDRVAIVLDNGPDGHLLHRLRQRRGQRAAESGLPRRRVRVLPLRPQRQALIVARGTSSPAIEVALQARRVRSWSATRRSRPATSRSSRAGLVPRRRLRTAASRSRRRRLDGAAHLGHHLAAQDRAAVAGQPHGLGRTSAHAAVHVRRLRAEHHAAVPHPRPHRRRAGAAVGGLAGVLRRASTR